MELRKYFELTDEFIINELDVKLFRIKCTRSVQNVEVGEFGGFVEKEENLCGDAWISGDAQISGNARIFW